ncbi:unnamed protein product [Rotaria magnacalcarata]|uniref:F-box domain-containing protein n=1 Tax=Rotaria magnacalcarata TaxID=392030 RepID=A0A814HYE6_9BILA|nr:unnamed protein product [Rotaria magnacalcarata]CAF4579351.1 unnamed protein product [Rotaria magnacalcarata]
MARRAREANTTVTTTLNNDSNLSDEIWQSIFLSISSFNNLICLSTVCRRFRKLILNEWFLKKYFVEHPKLFGNLIIYYNFSNVALGQNPFCNSIKSLKRGQWDNCINDQSEIIIEKDSSFDYSLKTIGDFVKIRNDYDLFRSRTILETCSFSFFFFLCKRPSSKDNSWLTVTLDLIEDRPRRSRPITIYVNAERHLEFSVNYAFCIQTQHSNSPKLQFDMWYHITVLIAQTSPDDTSIELYLNSQKLADYKLSKRFRPPYHDISIEASIRDTHLAEICIWKRKLTVKEIKTIFEQQTTLKRVDFVTDILSRVRY